MKFFVILMFLSVAYAQTEKTDSETEPQKQEEQTVKGPIENPYDIGPYKGDEFVPFDRLRKEKEESKEQREEEEAQQSEI